MVINRSEMKRKRKDDSSNNLLDDSPKRTKVHAQRKFAQGSNVNSPVITPVKEIEKQEKIKAEIAEPTELLPSKRPNTEDFLTFLCFRGTPILPASLNFFNSAAMVDSRVQTKELKIEPQKNGPILTSTITKSGVGSNEKPFIAFGVRKRADPILVSKQMDRKRRHALALQALRRKYQEQKMAKIRAVTISKLSEKVTNKSIVRTRSVTKNEATAKKSISTQKGKVKIISTKHIKVTTRTSLKQSIKLPGKQKMCLRSFKGKFVPRELKIKKVIKKRPPLFKKIKKKVDRKRGNNTSSEYSSDDDEPLVKTVKEVKSSPKVQLPRIAKKLTGGRFDINFRFTRSNQYKTAKLPPRNQTAKQKLLFSRSSTSLKSSVKSSLSPKSIKIQKQKEVKKKPENVKSKSPEEKSEKTKSKNQEVESKNVEPKEKVLGSQRPSRKTKEAAAIYMEILGHKLVNDGDADDDSISIDSFPELPNVRKMEQRENELKAKAKSKENETKAEMNAENNSKCNIKSNKSPKNNLQLRRTPRNSDKIIDDNNIETQVVKVSEKPSSDSDESKQSDIKKSSEKAIENPNETTKKKLRSSNTEVEELPKRKTRAVQNKLMQKVYFSDSDESFLIDTDLMEKKLPAKKSKSMDDESPKQPKNKSNSKTKNTDENNGKDNSAETENSDCITEKNKTITKKKLKKVVANKQIESFSDSDEEPLVKLTKGTRSSKRKELDKEFKTGESEIMSQNILLKGLPQTKFKGNLTKGKKQESINKKGSKVNEKLESSLYAGKPKRECTKRPQNYLTLFSSSDDDDKFFHGFDATKQNKHLKLPDTKCTHTVPSAELLCKDVGKRFGKGKVNMSTAQIEKWLKDSALAGTTIKKECEDIDEKLSTEGVLEFHTLDLENIKESLSKSIIHSDETVIKPQSKVEPPTPRKSDTTSSNSSPEKGSKSHSNERKMIFRKNKIELKPNVNAFSPNNESSVYAFEADNEDIVNTPFRRPPVRRPSSAATSKSEDDSSRCEDTTKIVKTFLIPPVVKSDIKSTNKQEVALILPDEESKSTSIAVQVNLEPSEVFTDNVNMECSTQTDTEENEHLFYIPLQPHKQTTQAIQGAAMKLGPEGTSGPNHVVMRTKLVTQTPIGVQKLEDKPLTISTPMYPPCNVVQKAKISSEGPKQNDHSENVKYKVPSSPSASSSSSTRIYKRPKPRIRQLDLSASSAEFPDHDGPSHIVEAPVYHPNDKEFQDPLEYIEKIRPEAERFGICRIVPPANFKPECKVSDDMRFTAYNQYVHKMLHRWGPNFKELMAIKKYLQTQSITLTHPPWIGGMEIDLPRLYQTVQTLGGLKEVIEKKKWPKVSEAMKIPKSAQDRVTKLDDIYCKYLLPYDTLSIGEREKLFDEIETDWAKRESRILLRSQQNVNNPDNSSNSGESETDDEAEECIVKGRSMALNTFYRIARNTMSMWFKTMEPSAQEVEQEFWKHVNHKQNHICVHSGSIDCGNWGYGFAVSKNSPFARHAWNLKVLTNNSGSVLRSMGPLMGVTVPTLHVGMVFSACCWYRDPHSLPWIEYLHTGASKIWYGIPNSMSDMFHTTLLKLVPNYCCNKTLWLPSDTAMIPPSLLVANGVSLCRTVQDPGQFIVVFPKVFTSSISTGYMVSESVYFAPPYWLRTASKVFEELQNSCEPSMFSWERLLLSIINDSRSNVEVLKQIMSSIELLVNKETEKRLKLKELGLKNIQKLPIPDALGVRKRKKLQDEEEDYECEICRYNLFVSMVQDSSDKGVYCLTHAIEHIESKKIDIKNCTLMFTYGQEMDNLIDKLKINIEMKLLKKSSGKSLL